MKTAHLLIAIPVFVFLALSATLDLGSLVFSYPGYDFTPYLAAQSLARDLDLACTAADSDRYFRQWEVRPSNFVVADRQILFASGELKRYPVFYYPDVFVYVLVPFVGALGFHGWMLLHALLILAVYFMGFLYYRSGKDDDGTLSAFNSVLYFTLIPLPVLFLLPTHHLYLFALVTAALFLGLRGHPVLSALSLGLAFSTQPWALLVGALLIGYWQFSGLRSESLRFVPVLAAAVAAVWGIEFLMYPSPDISNIRWVKDPLDATLNAFQTAVPQHWTPVFAPPSLLRVSDFLFGRTIGFLAYGTAAACLLLSSVWMWRDRLVNRTLMFTILVLVAIACTHPEGWGICGFASDFWIFLCAAAFFAAPAAQPRSTLIALVVISAIFAGPMLANPLGTWTSRNYYLQSTPYRFLPSELSLVGKQGLTSLPAYQFAAPGGKFYFLNDDFYAEPGFFWVHGGSTLEFLLEATDPAKSTRLQIANVPETNHVFLTLGRVSLEYHLQPSEIVFVDVSRFAAEFRRYEDHKYLHGTISSSSGFVPKLFSRENPDFRYLGCQVRFAGAP